MEIPINNPHDIHSSEPSNRKPLGPPPPSDALQILIISYLMVVVTIGLIGNTLLIYATMKFTTFGSDRVAVLLIRYLGIADILQIILLVFPALTLFLHQWVFEKWGCFLFVYLEKVLNAAHFLVILLITYHRLFRCISPCVAGTWTDKHAHGAVGVMMLVAVLEVPLVTFMMFSDDAQVVFNDRTRHVNGCFFKNMGGSIVFWQHLIDPYLPFILCIIGTLLLWLFAFFRNRYKINVRPLITVTAIVVLLSISWLPMIVEVGFKNVYKPHVVVIFDKPFLLRTISFLAIPIVFTVFNRPFADFAKKAIMRFLSSIKKKMELHSEY